MIPAVYWDCSDSSQPSWPRSRSGGGAQYQKGRSSAGSHSWQVSSSAHRFLRLYQCSSVPRSESLSASDWRYGSRSGSESQMLMKAERKKKADVIKRTVCRREVRRLWQTMMSHSRHNRSHRQITLHKMERTLRDFNDRGITPMWYGMASDRCKERGERSCPLLRSR